MTDRELLELAAKAAEIVIPYFDSDGDPVIDVDDRDRIWNPLADDGDALRLAVKLRLHVDHHTDHVSVWVMSRNSASGDAEQYQEFSVSDPYSATRRAIVRAAAEIGKGMP